jgi:hypothetical protein
MQTVGANTLKFHLTSGYLIAFGGFHALHDIRADRADNVLEPAAFLANDMVMQLHITVISRGIFSEFNFPDYPHLLENI